MGALLSKLPRGNSGGPDGAMASMAMNRMRGARRMSVGAATAIASQVGLIAPSSQTDQTRARTEYHASQITEMLAATTEGKVHIEETNVNYTQGYTDFVLSPDSCSALNEHAILSWFLAGRLDPLIYSCYKEDVLAPMPVRPAKFPYTPKQRVTTIIVRAQAGRAAAGYGRWLRSKVYLWGRLLALFFCLTLLILLVVRSQ